MSIVRSVGSVTSKVSRVGVDAHDRRRTGIASRMCTRFIGPLGLAWLGVMPSSCGDDHGGTSTGNANYAVPIPGCESYAYAACDILQPSCQNDVLELVKCIRQTPGGTMVPVQTITSSQYRDALSTQSAADTNSADMNALEKPLVLVGLTSPSDLTSANQVDVQVNTVPAFYSPAAKCIVIVAPDATVTTQPPSRETTTLTLAHEFVHALQDQQYDLLASSPDGGIDD